MLLIMSSVLFHFTSQCDVLSEDCSLCTTAPPYWPVKNISHVCRKVQPLIQTNKDSHPWQTKYNKKENPLRCK